MAGHVPHRGRLLLYPRLPAGYCSPGRWSLVAFGDADLGVGHSIWSPAHLSPGGYPQPPRRRLDRYARTVAALVAGQAVCAHAAGLCRYRLYYYHHSLSGRCHRSPDRKSIVFRDLAGAGRTPDPGFGGPAGGRFSEGLSGGDWASGAPGGVVSLSQSGGDWGWGLSGDAAADSVGRLATGPSHLPRQPLDHGWGGSAAVSKTGPGAVGV